MLTKNILVEHDVTPNLKVLSSHIKGSACMYPVPVTSFQFINHIG